MANDLNEQSFLEIMTSPVLLLATEKPELNTRFVACLLHDLTFELKRDFIVY